MAPRRTDRPRNPESLQRPDLALLAVCILVPLLLFVLAALHSRSEAVESAWTRVERNARILENHSLDVLDVHRMAIGSVESRLRSSDLSDPAQRASFQSFLERLQDDLRHVATITVVDSKGMLVASSRRMPSGASPDFADREWFTALADPAHDDQPYVSGPMIGRQSGIAVFNIAMRTRTAGGAFGGVVAISIDRSLFESFFRSVDVGVDHDATLVRADGAVLSSSPPRRDDRLAPDSPFNVRSARSDEGVYVGSPPRRAGWFFAFRKVGSWPVYVRFGISGPTAMAGWRRALSLYGVVAGVTALLLLGTASLAISRSRGERFAMEALKRETRERRQAEEQTIHLQKMDALGRLTGGIAHDFNNMLAVTMGGLDLAERRLRRRGAEGVPDAIRHLAAAREGADRAAALTRRLLAFARRQPLVPRIVDPGLLVEGVRDLVARTIGAGIVLDLDVGPRLWPVEVDPSQLENVLVNLAVNARDSMAGRGGRVDLLVRNRAGDGRDEVELVVRDDGCGMDAETVSRAFDPFFTTKGVGEGTGLGLSLAYGFARQSGGSIAIESAPGAGCTVTLRLPKAVCAAAEPVASEPCAFVTPAQGSLVLVVEDDDRVRQASVAAFRELGFAVLEAADGVLALEILAVTPRIDLVFTDVVMPRMNGIELAGRIAALHPDLPVIFTSGHARAFGVEGDLPAGADLLAKPFPIDELSRRVSARLVRTAPFAVAG